MGQTVGFLWYVKVGYSQTGGFGVKLPTGSHWWSPIEVHWEQ